MQVKGSKTILNRLQKQPGFVYGAVRFGEEAGRLHLEVELRSRANRQPRCAGCQRARPRARVRHPDAPALRVRAPVGAGGLLPVRPATRAVPPLRGARGGPPLGRGQAPAHETYAWFLAAWAKRLS